MTRGRSSLEGDTLGTTRGIVGGPHCIPAGAPSISDRQKKAILIQSAEEIRKVFLRADADKIAHTKVRVEDWVRDTPRHFAACRNDGSLIVLASDLALLPAKTFAAIIAHEFGHATDFSYPGSFLLSNRGDLVVRPQGRRSNQSVSRDVLERWEKRTSDEVETTADRIAERIMGIHIGYCGPCNLQTMLTGSPDEASCHLSRPRGLRLYIMAYKTVPDYTATSQSAITSQVPDSEDGSMAYAISEKTAWVLQKTSAEALGSNVIATKSGVGRWIKVALSTMSMPSYSDYLYGLGLNGSATLAANSTPNDSLQYSTYTIKAGVVLTIPNYALMVAGNLTMAAGAIISADGTSAAADSTAGAAGIGPGHLGSTTGTAGSSGGSAGASGSNAGGSTRTIGGTGGNGGNNGPRTGGVAGPAGSIANAGVFDVPTLCWRATGASLSLPTGGTPGAGGAGGVSGAGGGGGSGGCLCIVRAGNISVSAGALFRARGGAGGNRTTSDGSGGGGGGGGVFIVICNTFTMPGGSTYSDFFNVSGGAGGTSAGGLPGSNGNAGKVRLYVGGVVVYSLN